MLCDSMDCDGGEGPTEVLIDSKKMNTDVSSSDIGNSNSITGSSHIVDPLKNSVAGTVNSNSDLHYYDNEEDANDTTDYEDDEDASSYDENDDYLYQDDYSMMQSHFDNVNLPPGVEASLPWLKDTDATSATSMSTGSSVSNIKLGDVDVSESVNKAFGSNNLEDIAATKLTEVPTGTPSVFAESSSNGQAQGNDTSQKLQDFKQFDIVNDFSDHHFSGICLSEQPQKNWAKRIQDEWKILERDLPDTIFVRVYEARMDLLRAVIIGPAGTPYHDGLFVFDCLFPPKYPDVPPMVYYYSGGLRLNPNLYECGKVCLSLLGTWSGKQTEMWIPGESTMLQVLVSIQALILNAKPFFNEPGYESQYVGAEGDKHSELYNQDAFIFSLKTMMYTIRRPPKYFEDFVANHFRNRALDILVACKAYREGAMVGSVVVKDGIPYVDEPGKSSSADEFKAALKSGFLKNRHGHCEFSSSLGKMINILITNFTKNGSKDCEQFRVTA